MSPEFERLLDRLAMLQMGNKGNTEAHLFLEDAAKNPLRNAEESEWRSRGAKVFVPPKAEDRVIMFEDKSGVYVHSDGFCTPMGSDISGEVGDWTEVRP